MPEPGPGQVRIRVAAAAVNPVDVLTRSGAATAAGLLPEREVTGIGWDVAGTVDALGPEAAGFRPGDAVIGLSDRVPLSLKAQAEYMVLDADAVATLPAGTDLVAAATLPLGGLTAAQALDIAAAEPGDTLLVTGAAGVVGGYAVQLAARAGVRVVASAGAGDEELVRDLGAEFFVPRTADLPAAVRDLVPGGVHAAVDAASVGLPALDAVRGGGSLVSVLDNAPKPLRGIRVNVVWVRADGPRLAELAAAGLRLRVADVLPLDQVAEAHRRMAAGGLRGRLVLVP